MTNEFVFGYTFIGFPNVFEDPDESGPHQCRLQLQGPVQERRRADPVLRPVAVAKRPWCSIRAASKRAARRKVCTPTSTCPASATPLTKVMGTHTVKAGFFWEYIRNAQPANNNTNGICWSIVEQLQFSRQCVCRPGCRHPERGTTKASFNRINDIAYNTYEGFVQDSWKVTRRLTLELRPAHHSFPAVE